MSNYKGYLLKFGGTIVPNKYFLEYNSTPNQQMDSENTQRNNLGDLKRNVLKHTKSGVVFSTHKLNLEDKINFQNILANGLVNAQERKYQVTFWNDAINDYTTGYFYIPNVTYTIDDADRSTIWYQPITVELIEY